MRAEGCSRLRVFVNSTHQISRASKASHVAIPVGNKHNELTSRYSGTYVFVGVSANAPFKCSSRSVFTIRLGTVGAACSGVAGA